MASPAKSPTSTRGGQHVDRVAEKIDPADPQRVLVSASQPTRGLHRNKPTPAFRDHHRPKAPWQTCSGFVASYQQALASGRHRSLPTGAGWSHRSIRHEDVPAEMVPVLSGSGQRIRGVCDHWYYLSTDRNVSEPGLRTGWYFPGAGLDDSNRLLRHAVDIRSLSNDEPDRNSWKIYGYVLKALTISDYPDTVNADPSHFGLFADFQTDAANGQLPGFSYLEPAWSKSGKTIENDQHPVANVALGEKSVLQTCTRSLRTSAVVEPNPADPHL